MKKTYLAFSIFIYSISGLAQQEIIDSLNERLKIVSDTEKVNVLNQLADAYQTYDVDLAFELSQKALTLAEKLNFKKGIYKSTNLIGLIYEQQGKYNEAFVQFNHLLKIQNEIGDQKGIAKANVNVGIIFAEQGFADSARKYMFDALKIHKAIKDEQGIADVFINLGGTYELEYNWKKALEYYNQALSIQIKLDYKKGIAKSLHNIGFVYYSNKDYESAKKYLDQSSEIAIDIKELNLLQVNYQILTNIYEDEKQFEKAFHYQILFANLKDSLFKEKSIKQLRQLEEKYESGKKQKKIELLNKEKETQSLLSKSENKRKNIIIVFSTIGFLAALLFVFVLYNRFKLIKKQKILIEEKNKSITDSINYAKRIQNSMLPTEKYITKNLNKRNKN